MADSRTAFARFSALVMEDGALQAQLDAIDDDDDFSARVLERARAVGLSLDQDALFAALRPDVLGISRWRNAPVAGPVWPGRNWLPVHVATGPAGVAVDWAFFTNVSLDTPFFEDAIRRALRRPFNRVFRYRTAIADFIAQCPAESGMEPSGFIFHMSRCGSTLVHRMLGSDAKVVSISEPPPLDMLIALCRAWAAPVDHQLPYLKAMVTALGRKRAAGQRYFLKLDSWHTLSLPLFRAAFPSVPWIFLYRDPVEVLVSQLQERGMQTIPDPRLAALYGIAGHDAMSSEEYCARVLAAVCRPALEHASAPGAMLVNYRELPGAVCERILPHFGISCAPGQRAALAERARYDAKMPLIEFAADGVRKRLRATDAARALAGLHLGEIYEALEALRTA